MTDHKQAEVLKDGDLDTTQGGLALNLSVAFRTEETYSQLSGFGDCACKAGVSAESGAGTANFEPVTLERGVVTSTHTLCDATHL
ncbi:MAG: hypothetical protein AAFP68_13585 [Pseudomonadota bacterium]